MLLDFHQDMYNERFQGEGAPDWAIVGQAATENPSPQLGFPINYVAQNAVNHAYDAFWANTQVPGTGRGVQDFYAAAWAHVAKRFRGKPGVVGYNLFNEPWMGTPLQQCALAGGGTTPDACGIPQFEATTLTDFHRRVTRAIRRVDKRTMVFPAPILTFDFGGVTGVGKVDKRAGFAFNAYCGQIDPAIAALLPFLKGQPCSFSANLSFTHALDESRRNGDALFMTEFGATDELANFTDYLNGANALGISWTYWAYCGCGDPTTSWGRRYTGPRTRSQTTAHRCERQDREAGAAGAAVREGRLGNAAGVGVRRCDAPVPLRLYDKAGGEGEALRPGLDHDAERACRRVPERIRGECPRCAGCFEAPLERPAARAVRQREAGEGRDRSRQGPGSRPKVRLAPVATR